MFVAELRYPARDVFEEGTHRSDVVMEFLHLENALADVAVCLELFRFAQAQERQVLADLAAELDVPGEQRFRTRQEDEEAYWRRMEVADRFPPNYAEVDAAQGGQVADAAQDVATTSGVSPTSKPSPSSSTWTFWAGFYFAQRPCFPQSASTRSASGSTIL
jgi:hypothetical protein